MSRVWDESLNPYQILELEDGYKSTAEQIKKVKLPRLGSFTVF